MEIPTSAVEQMKVDALMVAATLGLGIMPVADHGGEML